IAKKRRRGAGNQLYTASKFNFGLHANYGKWIWNYISLFIPYIFSYVFVNSRAMARLFVKQTFD
ncbi:hypothetical protein, partial [Bacillus sp. BML-BC021]